MHEGQSRASLCGVFSAKGTGDPQIVIRGQASHGHSSVPIIRALGDVPSAPYLAINGGELASSVAGLSRSPGWPKRANAVVTVQPGL